MTDLRTTPGTSTPGATATPPAEAMTGAASLVRSLEAADVDVVFGIPGGAILPAYDPLLDSSNMTPAEWVKIARDVESNYDRYDGFVVLHGTDTMAYTASAVPFLLAGLRKPVIITGSQIPLCEIRNDARENLITSLMLAASYAIPEVCLYFGGKLLRGCRSTKVSADGFAAYVTHAGRRPTPADLVVREATAADVEACAAIITAVNGGDEAPWRARIHPLTPAALLGGEEVKLLHKGILEALRAGLRRQGSTLRDYRLPDGRSGCADRRHGVRRAGDGGRAVVHRH